jgi:glucose dehydrogenase
MGFLSLFVLAIVAVVGAGPSSAARTSSKVTITPAPAYTGAQLSQYAGDDWPVVGGDLQNDRYSSLTQITPANVSKLQLAWHIHMGDCATYQATHAALAPGVPAVCPGQEENAVEIGGVMYVATSQSNVYAYDATNGNLLWSYTPTFQPGYNIGGGGRQPGVSVGQGLVFLGQRDGNIVALNQTNGKPIWTAEVGPWQKGVSLSETPIYYDGEVIEGTSGGDGGSISNNMQAFNATTGALLWAFNLIPSHNQPGGNSWPWSSVQSNYGGAAMWENPAVDATNNLVIFGTGGPVPWNSRGPGADLYANSLVALNASTGQLKWYYQTVHHDLWDSDLPNEPVMFNMTVAGKTVPAVASVAKFGWTWVFNRVTGQPLEPVTQVKVPGDTAPDVNPAPVQPIPQTPNTLTGCVGGDPTSYAGANHCYDQPLKDGGGRLCADPGRWTGLTAPDGKPYDVSCHFQPYDTSQYVVAPFESMDWPNSSYDPQTNGFITCGVTNRNYGKLQIPAASQLVGAFGGIGSGILSAADSSVDPLNLNDFGNFSSLNMSTVSPTSGGKWEFHQIWDAPCYSGTVDTASGISFVGHLGEGTAQNGLGYLSAVNSKTGADLWDSPLMDAPAGAPPMTYEVNGVQYVSIVVGGESHNDPTRPNPSVPSDRVRGDSIYTYVLGS